MLTVVDVETTTFQKGNPYSRRNKLCYAGALVNGTHEILGQSVNNIKEAVDQATLIIGFNLKFDIAWCRREGLNIKGPVWDCQLAHFLLRSQLERYPSVNDVCQFYGLPLKDETVLEQYWNKGIDTPDIPQDVMFKYLGIDLLRTWQIYQKQKVHFQDFPKLYTLFRIHCQDLLVLQEMEWNGLKLDVQAARREAVRTKERLEAIEKQLQEKVAGGVVLNWDSVDDLSRFLYGGVITRENREIAGVYLSGKKVGQPRYRIVKTEYELPALTKPIEGSELKKAGLWSSDEKTLKQLKGIKPIVELLLERAKLSKLLDYYDGLPNLIEEMDWEDGELHGQLNQVTAITGRLSATNPNQQNQPPEVKQLIISRYAD